MASGLIYNPQLERSTKLDEAIDRPQLTLGNLRVLCCVFSIQVLQLHACVACVACRCAFERGTDDTRCQFYKNAYESLCPPDWVSAAAYASHASCTQQVVTFVNSVRYATSAVSL